MEPALSTGEIAQKDSRARRRGDGFLAMATLIGTNIGKNRRIPEKHTQQLHRVAMLLDVSLTGVALVAAYYLRWAVLGGSAARLWPHLVLFPVIAPLWIILLTFFGAYKSPRRTSRREYCWAVTRSVGTGLAVLLVLLFLLKIQYVSRVVLITFASLAVLSLTATRLLRVWHFRRSIQRGKSFHRVLIIGSGNRARRLAESLLRHAEWNIYIVGYLDPDPARHGRHILGASVVGTVDDITSTLKNHVIDEVVLAVPRSMITDVEKIVRACEEEGVRFLFMADVFDVQVARMRLTQFSEIPLLAFEPVAQEEWALLIKRIMDLTVCLLMLPMLLPLMAVIALAVKLDSPGPVFFVQDRVGLNKRRFRMRKFRTMVTGSERLQAQLEHLNEAQGPIFKIAKDPRITRLGRLLRRTSLDELPQVFNVIKGDMSLVGPRPMSLRDVNLFDRGIQRKRFSVKPGLTCLWQISGRSQLPFSKWLELDLSYIERWSLGLDIKILAKTVPVVLKGTGAV
jgi:exopolysaccharide biosynthesis polyprenyl glycosylphosphotransferase